MSNALLVGARRSATGKPLFVAGPQVGHFYPGLLLELDLEGGGYRARGVAFPGISFAILIGRGIDFAWSATSAGSDLVDQYVETLCGRRDTSYLWNGECREMTIFDAGTIVGRQGEPDRPLIFRETVHGPVTGYATVEGRRVAISVKRSTRGRELGSLSFFLDLSRNEVRSAQDFVRAASRMELAFNWLYADHRDIAQFTSGRLPVRPSTVDQGLPTKGTGEYEWRGFASPAAHAQAISPPSGLILNWNNKPSRASTPADDEWTWGSVQRVDLLWRGIGSRPKHTLGSVVGAMNSRGDTGSPRRAGLAGRTGGPRARRRDGCEPRAAAARIDEWRVRRRQPARRRPRRQGRRRRSGSARRELGPASRTRCSRPCSTLSLRAELEALVPNDPPLSANGIERLQRLVVVRSQGSPRAARSARCRARSRRGSAEPAT